MNMRVRRGGAGLATTTPAAPPRSRHKGLLAMTTLLPLLLLLCATLAALRPCAAEDTTASTEAAIAAEAMSSSMTSASASTDSSKATLESWYERQFHENETQLVGFPSDELQTLMPSGERPCRDLPSLQTRSTTFPTNGGCPAFFTTTGASCTCLTGYVIHPESWEFKVKKKTAMKKMPLNLRSNDTFEVDSISTLWANKTLTRLYVVAADVCVL